VLARNAGGDGALIGELTIRDSRNGEIRIATDKQWLSASSLSGERTPAREISTFDDSLWANHQHGPPQLETPSDTAATLNQMPWNDNLAMRWFKDQDRLVFDTLPQVKRPAGWYRFIAPPGLSSLNIPTTGNIRLWADGRELAVSGSSGSWHATLAEPALSPAVVAIRVEQTRGDYGGAAFSDFIRLRCVAGETTLGDWSKSGVLETYSGGAWYRKTFQIPAGNTGASTTLDLGEVAASAEVRVNGQAAGIKCAPPWKLDISRFVKPGENRIEILVCNTLANHYVTIPTHYRGSTLSGLLGPVKIEFSKHLR
jgi:hypothetical protein